MNQKNCCGDEKGTGTMSNKSCCGDEKSAISEHGHEHGHHEQEESKAGGGNIVYACPMHPEVTEDKPGVCPKCGMGLVKISPAETEIKQTGCCH